MYVYDVRRIRSLAKSKRRYQTPWRRGRNLVLEVRKWTRINNLISNMKFTEHLSAHITPEWRKQYINYEVSKEFSDF